MASPGGRAEADSSRSVPEVITLRPRRLRIVGTSIIILTVAVFAAGWFALPAHIRAQMTLFQALTLLLMLATVPAVILSLTRSYVRADDQGLVLRNGWRTHHVTWQRVHKLLLRRGDPWGIVLLLPADGTGVQTDLDTEKRQIMGVQTSDGERAVRGMALLKAKHAEYLRRQSQG